MSPWQCKPAAPFDCCVNADGQLTSTFYEGRPVLSPTRSLGAIFLVDNIFTSKEDYLLPLKGTHDNDRLVMSRTGNHYFPFLYLNASVVNMNNDSIRLWLQQWRLDRHPYLRIENHGDGFILLYDTEVLGRRVWYNIFSLDTTKDYRNQVEGEQPGMSVFHGDITEPITARDYIVRQVSVLRIRSSRIEIAVEQKIILNQLYRCTCKKDRHISVSDKTHMKILDGYHFPSKTRTRSRYRLGHFPGVSPHCIGFSADYDFCTAKRIGKVNEAE